MCHAVDTAPRHGITVWLGGVGICGLMVRTAHCFRFYFSCL
jgi:hypothetical protein